MNNVLQLNEFFVEGGRQFQSHVLLHITEPSTPAEQEKGYFFAICEVNQADNKYLLKLQDIIEEIENGYYETEDTFDKTSLEIVLDKANHESFSLLKKDIDINCVVGAIRPPEIIFSFYGTPPIVLFYKEKDGNYKKMDLTKGGQEATENTGGKEYLFPQIIQGKITPNDYLFMGTKHVTKYFNHDRLHKVITSRPPEQSSRHIEKVLSELDNGFSFGGIVIHVNEHNFNTKNFKENTVKKPSKDPSVNTLFVTEQNTESTLSPSMLQRVNKKIKEIVSTEEKTSFKKSVPAQVKSHHMRPHRTAPPVETSFTEKIVWFLKKIINIGQLVWQIFLWIAITLWSVLGWIGRTLGLFFFVITNMQNRRRNILQNWRKDFDQIKNYLKNLPTITKILLISTISIGIIIITSIAYINKQKKIKERNEFYIETLQKIKIKKDNAESSLIYNNENEARRELNIAKKLLSTLPCETPEQKNNCKNLSSKLEEISVKIRHLKIVAPTFLTNLSIKSPTWTNGEIIKIKNKILIFSDNSPEIFIYNLLTKELKQIDNTISPNGFKAGAVPKENDYAILLYNDKEVARFNPEKNTLEKIEIFYNNDNVKITNLAIYNRRLYTVDIKNNQIYKHDAIKTGFGQGKNWLKDKADLSFATDIAIEGDIFISQNSSQILRFSAGRMNPTFLVSLLEPDLTKTNEIWTYTDLDYIYILDGSEKRLIIFNKKGGLKEQITAKEFINPTGMVVDEPSGKAFIFDNKKLYEISLI